MKILKVHVSALLLLLGMAVFYAPSSSYASGSACEKVLLAEPSTFWQRTKNYASEVRDTNGVRLFLKDSQASDPTKWHGFLTKYRLDPSESRFGKYYLAIMQYVPRKLGEAFARESGYLFTPFMGIYDVIVKKPVEYLTTKFSNRKKEPAFFLKVPSILALSLSMYIPADMVYQNRLDAHIQSEITSNAPAFEHSIQNDYRYNKIKQALNKGEITHEEAQKEAYLVSLAYSSYFDYRASSSEAPTLQSEMKLIDHFLFAHLKKVITEGVEKMDSESGYRIPDSAVGPLKDAQKMELFANAHQRYLKYQIIQEMVGDTAMWKEISTSGKLKGLADSIANDPFTKELVGLKAQGKITEGELQSYLQEDAYWQNKFQDWNTLGITRLKNDDGQFIDQALTLSDIREEVLAEIASKKP
jgi:hypothetical protein